ncbi:TnsA-like heteromeric transposase endonuclease subunit [Pseudonocardia xinjiangensis]|uniref:TnsA-like heteromeric transposase endonuclease subunit n=1 Tax=Pseudonocardia xinjiangensis TaxID=75289 RepID=UPI003D8CE1D5
MRGGRTRVSAEFEVGFVYQDGGEVRVPLAEAATVAFERIQPVRSFPSYKGQSNFPGFYYAASLDAHVECESWLERDTAMELDFDAAVLAFAAQPFWLGWSDNDRARSHAPDFFARTADGRGMVLDCRPVERVKPRDAAAFAATKRACAEVGWEYRLVTGHDPVWLANLRWLAGYRHRRCYRAPVAAAALETFAELRPLMSGAELVGDPIAVLPTIYHLIWSGQLSVELSTRLDATSLVSAVSV